MEGAREVRAKAHEEGRTGMGERALDDGGSQELGNGD